MAIWLRRQQHGFLIQENIIRRDEWQDVVALDAAFLAIDTLTNERILAAEVIAAQIKADAEAAARQMLSEASIEAARLCAVARQEGFQSGLTDWNAKSLRAAKDVAGRVRRERVRLAQIVVTAVEKIIPLQDPQGTYKQVVRVLSKSIQSVRYVTVRVSPCDLVTAHSAFAELAAKSEFAKIIEVVSDERLSAGACLVESDQGVIDLSLGSQLAALRAVIDAAIQDDGDSS